MNHSKKIAIVSIVLSTLGMGLAGCGGDDDGGSAKASCAECSTDLKSTCEEAATECAKQGTKAECQDAIDILCGLPIGDGGA